MRHEVAALLTVLLGISVARADPLPIVPPGSVVGGQTIAQWTGG
jgi:hypothetical protein